MQTRKLGKSDLGLSAVGLGCMGLSFGYGPAVGTQEGIALIRSAVDLGVTFFDTAVGRFLYSRRMGVVEPVFADITHALGIKRLGLRGKIKADIQWKLCGMVHNIMKILRYSPRFAYG